MPKIIPLVTDGYPAPTDEAGDTVPVCLQRHLDYLRQRGLADSSIYKRRLALIKLREYIGHDLFQVNPAELEAWRAELADRVMPSTTMGEIWHVKDFYAWAQQTRRMRTNPAAFLRYPRLGRRIPRPIAEEKLLYALSAAPAPLRQMFVLAGWCGLRACEIAGLRRSNVLDHAKQPALLIEESATKGHHERVIPMSDFVLAELLQLPLPAAGYVFRRADGRPGPNKPWRVSHMCNTFLHEAGLDEVLHQLRHRFGTQTFEVSQNIRIVQELLGHRSLNTTMIYTAYSNAQAVATVQSLPVPPRLRPVKGERWVNGGTG